MGSSSAAPAPPDYSGVANASQKAAQLQYQTSQDQLNWAKTQYADAKPTTDRINASLINTLDTNTSNAAEDRARYQSVYQPVEDAYVDKAMNYDSEGNLALQRGRATTAVAQQFDAAGQAAQRQLEGFGIDPSTTRSAALDVGVKVQKAAAMAGAANQSDVQTKATADQLRANAISVGRGYPAQTTAEYGTGTQAGMGAVGNQNSTYSAFAPALGNPTAWQGLGNQSIGTWGSTLNNMYSAQMSQYNANQNSSSGIGAGLGMVAGLGSTAMMAFSDARLKENITPVGKTHEGIPIHTFNYKGHPQKHVGMIAQQVEQVHPEAVKTHSSGYKMVDYHAIPTEGAGPARPHYAGGGAIPDSMSPSGGQQTDDVKINANAGEFMLPKDYVSWVGEEKIQKMILKSREDRMGGKQVAKPAMRPSGPAIPTGGQQARPPQHAGALPI